MGIFHGIALIIAGTALLIQPLEAKKDIYEDNTCTCGKIRGESTTTYLHFQFKIVMVVEQQFQ